MKPTQRCDMCVYVSLIPKKMNGIIFEKKKKKEVMVSLILSL